MSSPSQTSGRPSSSSRGRRPSSPLAIPDRTSEAMQSAVDLFAAIETVLQESSSCPFLNFGTRSSRSSFAWNDAADDPIAPMSRDVYDPLTAPKLSKPQRLRKSRSLSESDLGRLAETIVPPPLHHSQGISRAVAADDKCCILARDETDAQSQ